MHSRTNGIQRFRTSLRTVREVPDFKWSTRGAMSSYVLLGELCNFFFGVLWKESLRLESPVLSEIGGGATINT